MIFPRLVMSPVTANVPSILTEPIKSMATAVTVTALTVTTAGVPPTAIVTVPLGKVMV